MQTIYKYPLVITDQQKIDAPLLANKFESVIHAGLDANHIPCIWCEIDTENTLKTITVYIVGTGNPLPMDTTKHVGSFVQGPFVWHVYV